MGEKWLCGIPGGLAWKLCKGVPHASGDEPNKVLKLIRRSPCSPRVWG